MMNRNSTQNLKRAWRFLGLFCLCAFFLMRAGMALAARGEEKSLAAAKAAYKAKNYSLAIKLFRPLAESGDAAAEGFLGRMYGNGRGVEKDYAKAVKWYRKSAEQGNAYGQLDLGGMYANGQGVPQNYVEAYKWFALAGAQGNADASTEMGNLSGKMTPDQIAKAQELASSWKAVGQAAVPQSSGPTLKQ